MFAIFIIQSLCFVPKDPEFERQFYLKNTGKYFSGLEGEDLNVLPAWERNITGKGASVVILAEGVLREHDELKPRVDLGISWNYEDNTNDPIINPTWLIQDMGTQIAGIIGASSNNECGIGIAPEVTLGVINVLSPNATAHLNDGILKYINNTNVEVMLPMGACAQTPEQAFQCFPQYVPGNDDYFKQTKGILVIPTVGVKTSNEDTSMGSISQGYAIFPIQEITQRGGETVTSIHGHNIIASAVTGGADFNSKVAMLVPQLVSSSKANNSACSLTVSPLQRSAAMAAGVIALMLHANPKLSHDDISTIIALTSARNDPSHPSWKKNAAGMWYSNVFGFGRLDADAATQKAANWKGLPASSTLFVKDSKKYPIPTFLSGFINISLKAPASKLKAINFINFVFSLTDTDISPLRIWLVSPSGTSINFKEVSSINTIYLAQNIYRYVIRDFYGEDPNGEWTVRILRESIGPAMSIYDMDIQIYGWEEQPDIIKDKKVGKNPYQAFPEKEGVKLNIEQKSLKCDDILVWNVSAPTGLDLGEYDLVISNDSFNRIEPICSGNANKENKCQLTCNYGTYDYNIRVQHHQYSASYTLPDKIHIENRFSSIIHSPSPYQIFNITQGYVIISLNMTRDRTFMSPFQRTQAIRISVYDLDGEKVIYDSVGVLTSNILVLTPKSYPHCILTAVPLEVQDESICHTMLQPISIIQSGESIPDPFEIPWNFKCPVPQGVIVPEKDDDDKKSSTLLIIICCTVIPISIGLICLFVWLYYKYIKAKNSNSEKNNLLITVSSD